MDENMYCPNGHGRKEGDNCDECGAQLVSATLTDQEMGHPGCGSGTPNACFALTLGPGGTQCALLSNSVVAQAAGIQLGWRVNFDPADELAWCAKGVLSHSKKPS